MELNVSNSNQLMNKYINKMPDSFIDEIKTGGIMENPVMHGCGNTFDRASIVDWLSRKKTCPTCRQDNLTIEDFKPNLALKNAIEEFPDKVLREMDEDKILIYSLKNEKIELNKTIGKLSKDLDAETNKKNDLIAQSKVKDSRIDYLSNQLDSLNIESLNDDAIKNFIVENPSREIIPNRIWLSNFKNDHLFHSMETMLNRRMAGRSEVLNNNIVSFFKYNGFISNSYSKEDKYKNKRIIDSIYQDKKQMIKQNINNKTTSIPKDGYQNLLYPLADKLITEGFVLRRLDSIAKENKVSIAELGKDEWNNKDPNRYKLLSYFSETYESSMTNLVSDLLFLELSHQMINSLEGLPDTENQKQVGKEMDERAKKARTEESYCTSIPVSFDGGNTVTFV